MSLKIGVQERIITFRTFSTIFVAIISSLIAFIVKNYDGNNLKLSVLFSIIGINVITILLLYFIKMLFYYINKLEGLKNVK